MLRLPLLVLPSLGFLLRLIDRGELKAAVIRLLFGGMPRTAIDEFAERYARQVLDAGMLREAVAALHSHLAAGDHVVLLSASPNLYVPRIGALLGVHETHCTRIRWSGDRLDGRLEGKNRRDAEKLRVLEQLRAAHPGLPAIAYGNSAPDLIHMRACDEAVYVNADAALARQIASSQLTCVRWM
jgi:phosphatidylglycerophosphatase C